MSKLQRALCKALQADLAGEGGRVPEAGIAIWNAFAALSAARTWHASGPNPIGYPAIMAWCQLMRVPLEPHHVDCVTAMDRMWTSHIQQQMRRGKGLPEAPDTPKASLTASLFDAVVG